MRQGRADDGAVIVTYVCHVYAYTYNYILYIVSYICACVYVCIYATYVCHVYARRGDGGAGIHAALTVLVYGSSAGMCVFFGVDMCAGQVRADDSDRARAGGADSGLMARRRVWAAAAWRATVTGETDQLRLGNGANGLCRATVTGQTDKLLPRSRTR